MTKILWRRSFQRSGTMCIVIMFLAIAALSGRGGDSYLSLKYQNDEETSFRQLKPSYKWTFMAYLAGDNSLEKDMKRFVNDMERVGSSEDVAMVVEIDGKTSQQTPRYFIKRDTRPFVITSPIVDPDTSEKNSADPDQLAAFVCWAVDTYPAEHYCLVISDHASGWVGICLDETSDGSVMNLTEIKMAFATIDEHLAQRNQKLDIVILHACFTGMIEVFYQLRDYIEYSIATEGLMGKNYISFKTILQSLINNPHYTPNEYARKIVDDSIDLAFYHMDNICQVAYSVDILARALLKKMPEVYIIDLAFRESVIFDPLFHTYPHDLYLLAQKLLEYITDQHIRDAATSVMKQIKQPQFEGEGIIDSSDKLNGIAICFPPKRSEYDAPIYDRLDFAIDTQWDEFLFTYYKIRKDSYPLLHQPQFPFLFKPFNRLSYILGIAN